MIYAAAGGRQVLDAFLSLPLNDDLEASGELPREFIESVGKTAGADALSPVRREYL